VSLPAVPDGAPDTSTPPGFPARKPGSRPEKAEPGRPSLQVLERAFAVLEAFTEFHPEWATSDLARYLDLPIPTVHRLLAALARLGYVTKDEQSRRFRLGGAAMQLGARAQAGNDLGALARLALRQLSKVTDETAVLTVLNHERNRSVCLERVETSQPLRLSVQPGRELPLHAGASQKALLAFMPDREIDRLLERPLERLSADTITEPGRLRRDLEAIRERGWASSHEETNIGSWGIAVPVIAEDDVVCAVGIAGPNPRLSDEVLRRDVPTVQRAALAIARSLGLAVPPVSLPSQITITPRPSPSSPLPSPSSPRPPPTSPLPPTSSPQPGEADA
jgi:IclR family transcriptional regulator, acetate operon repressor